VPAKAGPCIFPATAQPTCNAVGRKRGLRREAVQVPRRKGSLSEERPPSFLSHAVENPRPLEPAFTRLAGGVAQDREPEPTLHRGEAMDKQQAVCVGIDVSARELVVALGSEAEVRTFGNSRSGHQQLLAWLRRRGATRVCLEASGNYSLDLALRLSQQADLELALANPRLVRRFAESLGQRSKTDPVDARVLAEYARRMPLARWQPPSRAALQVRALTRTIAALTRMHTQQRNREHAVTASEALPAALARELARHQRYLEQRIAGLRRQAQRLVAREPELGRRYQHLLSVPGIAEASALQILGELAVLPATLDARQWVAHAGLDPQHHQSGSSVHGTPRISKAGNRYLRAALYMPALVAVHHDPSLGGFYRRLQERGKAKLAALTAVMRKLLHGIYGMFRRDLDYDGHLLAPASA
jgi:transposase